MQVSLRDISYYPQFFSSFQCISVQGLNTLSLTALRTDATEVVVRKRFQRDEERLGSILASVDFVTLGKSVHHKMPLLMHLLNRDSKVHNIHWKVVRTNP